MGQRWPDCDADIKAFVNGAVAIFRGAMPETLEAVFLHGSLAMGSFYRPKSDIDLLVLAREPLDQRIQKTIHRQLLALAGQRPMTGFIELSVILAAEAKAPRYPLPYELHFGEDITEPKVNGFDPDLSAHLALCRTRGVSLFGGQPQDLIGPVPWEDYVRAVRDDLEWIVEGENILESPFYGVLNICRWLHMQAYGEGLVESKEEGALWAQANLPDAYHEIIGAALDCYKSSVVPPQGQRRTGGLVWDATLLLAFRDFARGKI